MGMPETDINAKLSSVLPTPAKRIETLLDIIRPFELSAYQSMVVSVLEYHRVDLRGQPYDALDNVPAEGTPGPYARLAPHLRSGLDQLATNWQYLDYRALNQQQKIALNPIWGLIAQGELADLGCVWNSLFDLPFNSLEPLQLKARMLAMQRDTLDANPNYAETIPDAQWWAITRDFVIPSLVVVLMEEGQSAWLVNFLKSKLKTDPLVDLTILLTTIFLLERDEYPSDAGFIEYLGGLYDTNYRNMYLQCMGDFGHNRAQVTLIAKWQVTPTTLPDSSICDSTLYDSLKLFVSADTVAFRLLQTTVPENLQSDQFWRNDLVTDEYSERV
ncbi:hypothetical protein H4R33_004468 [Dimargaris cristalligena]|nr:hypothetical protein H4R33_004468 [Dimargaris cristalligena]